MSGLQVVPINIEDERRLAAFAKRHGLPFYELAIRKLLDLPDDIAARARTDRVLEAAFDAAEEEKAASLSVEEEGWIRSAVDAAVTFVLALEPEEQP